MLDALALLHFLAQVGVRRRQLHGAPLELPALGGERLHQRGERLVERADLRRHLAGLEPSLRLGRRRHAPHVLDEAVERTEHRLGDDHRADSGQDDGDESIEHELEHQRQREVGAPLRHRLQQPERHRHAFAIFAERQWRHDQLLSLEPDCRLLGATRLAQGQRMEFRRSQVAPCRDDDVIAGGDDDVAAVEGAPHGLDVRRIDALTEEDRTERPTAADERNGGDAVRPRAQIDHAIHAGIGRHVGIERDVDGLQRREVGAGDDRRPIARRRGEHSSAVVGDDDEILVHLGQRFLERRANGDDEDRIEAAAMGALLDLAAIFGDRGANRRRLPDQARRVLEAEELLRLVLDQRALGLAQLGGDDLPRRLARRDAERDEDGGDEQRAQAGAQPGELRPEGQRRKAPAGRLHPAHRHPATARRPAAAGC